MNIRILTADDVYLPNKMVPFSAALAFHFLMFVWNPTIMTGGSSFHPPEIMQVKYEDRLPPVVQPEAPKPPPPAVKKHEVKKAHKSGLSMATKPAPVLISRHRPVPSAAPPAPKPFVSHVQLPKFVPRSSEDIVAASPAPGISAPSPHRMQQAFVPPTPLKGKTRGIRAADIGFQLTDRGSLAATDRVIAIPVGEERGETAVLPGAAVLHDAPKGIKTVSGYRFTPGVGTGSGELAGKNKTGSGYHGVIQADTYVEGSLSAASGTGKGKMIGGGQGVELSGPVGDRKVLSRKLPAYPEWAEEKGISALVKIYFTVRPDGSIRTSMRILRSSGYTELDQIAKEALMKWRFSSTSASSSEQEAWGVITFRFTLA